MKRIILIAGIAVSLTACHNNEKEAQQRTIDSMQNEMARQHVIDSMNQAVAAAEAAEKDAAMSAQTSTGGARSSSSSGRTTRHSSATNNYYSTTNNYSNPTPAQPAPATTQQKKRWSSKATGALIGAGAGALGGALISDKKGQGAVIGGLGGAAVGLGTGAIIDAERKKKEERQQQQQ